MSDEWVVTMPKLGETVTEGTIGSWRKQVGETVEFDDPLFEVSTDKVDSEIPSPYDGVIVEIMVGEGETVPGGPALNDPANPAMGGSEGTAGADPEVGVPTGVVHDFTMPKLGETVTEGT